jgi:hypothetical protein
VDEEPCGEHPTDTHFAGPGRFLTPGGAGLIASPYRVADERFADAVRSHRLACSAESATARAEDGRAINGTIYRVSR